MTILLVPFLALLAAHGATSAMTSRQWMHIRPVTPVAAALIADAANRVPAVRSLLDALEGSDVVVYVSQRIALSVTEPPAFLRFVSSAGGKRYLAVEINFWQTGYVERMASLGHELQHAVEIAGAPEVQDTAGLVRLYRRIGWQVRARQFETRAARATSQRVRQELIRGRR